jgi:DNA-binding GntR family transcriptional regulator
MKHLLTVAATALMLVACSDNPAAPVREAPRAAVGPSLSIGASSAALDFTDLSNDMVTRLLPSFDDQAVAATIETSMQELNARAIAGEIADAKAASQAIRSSLKEGVANAQLLDVMNRTLDVVDRALDAATAVDGEAALTL